MSQPSYNPEMAPPPQAGWVPPDEKNFGEAPPPYPGNPAPVGGAYQQQPPAGAAYPPAAPMSYAQTTYVAPPMTTTTVLMTGNCPRCHMGNLIEESNTGALVCIIILVILFFPIGLLYLLCLPGAVERRCPQCGYCTD